MSNKTATCDFPEIGQRVLQLQVVGNFVEGPA